MKYCNSCNVDVVGKRKICPLCQERVSGDKYQEEVFPKILFVYRQYSEFFKIMLLISIIIATLAVSANILVAGTYAWSLFILGVLGSVWASLINLINQRKNIPKNIWYQVLTISAIALVWDFLTGWRGWSINYVIPLACVFAMISMAIISKIRKLHIEDYILYIIIDGLFGIVPVIFIIMGFLDVLYPSVICIATSVISLATIIIFEDKSLIAEIKRRLHV